MTNVITVTQDNFEEQVLASDLPVIVDYFADWCGPCRRLGPVIEEIAAERAGSVKVAKVNVDEQPGLAAQAGVQSIPFVVLYRDGTPAARSLGALPKRELEQALELDAPMAEPMAETVPAH